MLDESGIKEQVVKWAGETIIKNGITELQAKSIAHSFGLYLLEHGFIKTPEQEIVTPADIRIRKVRVLGDRARKTADEMGLDEDDLVIVTTDLSSGFPVYKLEKIEGSPVEYLRRRLIHGEKAQGE